MSKMNRASSSSAPVRVTVSVMSYLYSPLFSWIFIRNNRFTAKGSVKCVQTTGFKFNY